MARIDSKNICKSISSILDSFKIEHLIYVAEDKISITIKIKLDNFKDILKEIETISGISVQSCDFTNKVFVFSYYEIVVTFYVDDNDDEETISDGIKELDTIVVGSYKEYIEAIDTIIKENEEANRNSKNLSKKLFFRGEDYCYSTKCVPSAFRIDENKLNKQYYDAVTLFPNEFNNLSYLGTLCKMQHYGLPTRLLDVTSNPLVGLYFATKPSLSDSTYNYKSGFVYVFSFAKNNTLSFDSDKALFLSVLEKLNKREKELLYNYLTKYKHYAITPFIVENNIFGASLDTILALTKFIYEAQRERSALLKNHRLVPSDLLNCYQVYSRYTNQRIAAQSGSFVIFGLEIENDIRKRIKVKSQISLPHNVIKVIEIQNKKNIQKELDEYCNVNEATMLLDTENCFKYVKNRN